MADNTFYIIQPLVFGNIKLKAVGRGREREREENVVVQRYLQFSLKSLFNRVS